MDFCLLKDGVVVGTVSTMDPNFQPPEGHTLGPAGGSDHSIWDGERYLLPQAQHKFYSIVPDVFSAEACARIIELAIDAPSGDGKVIKNGIPGQYLPEIRRSKLSFLRPNVSAEIDALIARIWSILREQNDTHFGFRLARIFQLQISRYDSAEKGHFDWHTDRLVEPDGFERKLSLVVQLSPREDYEGGVFELQDLGAFVFPQGSALIFPSPLLHRVTPVTAGVRHSLVTWVQGPIEAK
jgi:PKHD-type hydroxylase